MKTINKTEICELIMDMDISSFEIDNPLDSIDSLDSIDLSTNDEQGRHYLAKRSRHITIRIKGDIPKPDIQL
jgi:hypothetical protein